MNSDTIKDHGATDRLNGQAKQPWVTPSLQIIALKSAESGFTDILAHRWAWRPLRAVVSRRDHHRSCKVYFRSGAISPAMITAKLRSRD